ncbi:MAG TPA: Rieske (2Fe-2S) protein [Puia sp.]|nr:Rieske (2Fe-2S) protein [Puia sp.]
MERKAFLKTCGFACLGGTMLATLLEGCSGSKVIEGTIDHSDLVVPVSSFQLHKDSFRKYVVVQHEKLKYPVCVYRFSETAYTALLMRCTHQGAELQVFGARLQCPAHGSEFNNKGVVQTGPADTNLRTFPVTLFNNQLLISLK